MEIALVIIQACVVIGAIVLGVRTGGIGLGLWGVVGTVILVFVFRLPPGSPPDGSLSSCRWASMTSS